jgi:two-component system phosphate regulon response regulator PhoB
MDRVIILATDSAAETFEDFEHNNTVFAFRRLTADGAPMLLEGAVWVFVDWVMPDLSGLEMCRRLRADARTEDAHITMVLERDDPEDRRRALRAGADDYLVGSVDRQTILDRVLALRPSLGWRSASHVISAGQLRIDLVAERAFWESAAVTLRPNEFRLLRFFAENPNRVLTRRELIDAIGKSGNPEYLRTVDVWVRRLRHGLRQVGAGHVLRTVYDKGYVLDL